MVAFIFRPTKQFSSGITRVAYLEQKKCMVPTKLEVTLSGRIIWAWHIPAIYECTYLIVWHWWYLSSFTLKKKEKERRYSILFGCSTDSTSVRGRGGDLNVYLPSTATCGEPMNTSMLCPSQANLALVHRSRREGWPELGIHATAGMFSDSLQFHFMPVIRTSACPSCSASAGKCAGRWSRIWHTFFGFKSFWELFSVRGMTLEMKQPDEEMRTQFFHSIPIYSNLL